jgi:hypothetical protein
MLVPHGRLWSLSPLMRKFADLARLKLGSSANAAPKNLFMCLAAARTAKGPGRAEVDENARGERKVHGAIKLAT